MLGVIVSLAGLIKLRSAETVVDGTVFRLHYRLTAAICFTACALVAAAELVGEPIQCLMGGEEAPKFITTYCWVSSTFTINTSFAMGEYGAYESTSSRFSGIGPYQEGVHLRRVHGYYQWVPFALFGMGCIFYLPHIFWKGMEGKRVESLLQGLHLGPLDDETAPEKRRNIVRYLLESRHRLNSRYAYGYLCMQTLNLLTAVMVMLALDKFFNGAFLDYGHKTAQYLAGNTDVEHDPMIYVFPRVVKCTFRQFGASGSLQIFDALCLLPQNIMNEKVFLVIWYWLVLLTTITAVEVVVQSLQVVVLPFRRITLERVGQLEPSPALEDLVNKTDVGTCFLLICIARNLGALAFKEVLELLLQETSRADETAPPATMFSPYAPSYKHFDPDEFDDPMEAKRRMEADTSV